VAAASRVTDHGAPRDEVELLERSLADARGEHARGELSDAGLAAIERRDGARLDAARTRLGPTSVAPEHPGERSDPGAATARRRPRWLLAVAAACLAGAAAVLVVAVVNPFATARPLGPTTRHNEVVFLLGIAEDDLVGHPRQALTAFEAVLRLDPTDAEALVEEGWLRYEYVGLPRHDPRAEALGLAELRHAVRVAPRNAAGHLYYGIVLDQLRHDRRAARAQVRRAASLPESPSLALQTTAVLAYLSR
jgi:hypothetical protein